ncbi:5-deoxy-glucuronate isomerase [Paenibacillus alginolyticus]|uniref:5-deoxy-glucuronate isomerase n=1 Tax=Paenibacillus alginolyticus TaxID=59839 RepID=A0ABT4GLZ5_9BACL|nr:5-deoxy-glucuronate isomerase [Paenibacillus alginolyticus]MCY9697212.1 5-deoxy-glucuronate isomerase [Paenibacillus alginolyticus]MEC0143678.1 5-deoxy-glucuronate isomerase [Paenibacillus alginolyticus]
MNRSKLIVTPSSSPNEEGSLLKVTPESAGWQYVGFEVVQLAEGQILSRETAGLEVCLVLLTGKADVLTKQAEWKNIGQRMSVFEKVPPYSVYVPNDDRYEVIALTAVELAICSAPGAGNHSARLISPDQVGVETRGYGNIERQIHNILPEQEPADSLLVVEVFTPNGHWSSYPPHKHDRDALPDESFLEETYYYRVDPGHGFAVQRVYTDDRSLDETLIVKNGETVLVPRGYHPVSAPPGYDVYYLNVMAGPTRTWKFHNDTEHAWIMTKPREA